MTAVRFTLDRSGDYQVRFSYAPDVVAIIKSIPADDRQWSPELKFWGIAAASADTLAAQLRRAGHAVTGHTQRTAPRKPTPFRPTETWAESFLRTMGPQRQAAAFRAMSKVLHPDVETGDAALMRELTSGFHSNSL